MKSLLRVKEDLLAQRDIYDLQLQRAEKVLALAQKKCVELRDKKRAIEREINKEEG